MLGMKYTVAFTLIVAFWGIGLLQGRAGAAAQSGSTWSGVYTEAQAKAGQQVYTKACAECHGQDLAGDGFAPALKGPEFMNNWNGLTAGELFERIRISMPPTNPNAVSAKEKAEILAFLFHEAGFPAGETALPSATDALKAIKFDAVKPGR